MGEIYRSESLYRDVLSTGPAMKQSCHTITWSVCSVCKSSTEKLIITAPLLIGYDRC